jgi:hypothetical protein
MWCVCIYEWINEWMNEWINEWINEWPDERTNVCTYGRTYVRMYVFNHLLLPVPGPWLWPGTGPCKQISALQCWWYLLVMIVLMGIVGSVPQGNTPVVLFDLNFWGLVPFFIGFSWWVLFKIYKILMHKKHLAPFWDLWVPQDVTPTWEPIPTICGSRIFPSPFLALALSESICGWLRNPAPVDRGFIRFIPLFLWCQVSTILLVVQDFATIRRMYKF